MECSVSNIVQVFWFYGLIFLLLQKAETVFWKAGKASKKGSNQFVFSEELLSADIIYIDL